MMRMWRRCLSALLLTAHQIPSFTYAQSDHAVLLQGRMNFENGDAQAASEVIWHSDGSLIGLEEDKQLPKPQRLAMLFDSKQCRSGIADAVAQRWQYITPEFEKNHISNEVYDASHPASENNGVEKIILYVRNQKVASEYMVKRWEDIFPKQTKKGLTHINVTRMKWVSMAHEGVKIPATASNRRVVVFSIVREPLGLALAAYVEVLLENKQACVILPRQRKERAAQLLEVLPGQGAEAPDAVRQYLASLQEEPVEEWCAHQMSQPYMRESVDKFERLNLYLDAMEQRQDMGPRAFHSYPQVLKLDVIQRQQVAPQRFDALLQLEDGLNNSDCGLPYVGKLAGVDVQSKVSGNKDTKHSSKKESFFISTDEVMQNPKLAKRLCRMYKVDYDCLGYRLPDVCKEDT